jgi:hypothetical protein
MGYKSPEKGGVKIIEVEGKRDKGKEVIVQYGIDPPEMESVELRRFFRGMEQDLFYQEKEINPVRRSSTF